jgi:1-acyl-sn-glycerol-3-phosphate acyltransferase
VVLDADRVDRRGGFILACTHLSNLEPFVVSSILTRRVRWMARAEFYRRWWSAAALRCGGAFCVDRFGNAIPAVRKAVALARAGEVVGIFPEGGVAQGVRSVMRGAPFKHGACTAAVATRLPIVPVVVLGTHDLNRVEPWLPFRRGRVWVAFGREVLPPGQRKSRRADRLEMASRLQSEFVRTYNDLLERTGQRDSDVP